MSTLTELLSKESPEFMAKAQAKADAMVLDIHLAKYRELTQHTQTDIAEALGIKQPTVAGMERAGQDIKLSSLKKYIEATGGKLRLDIELPDGSHYGFNI